MNKKIIVLVQAGPASFDSLAPSTSSSVIDLGVDATSAPITLTTGSDNASTTILGSIVDVGNFTKAGTGTMIVSGSNTYNGATAVNAGGTLQAGSATGLSRIDTFLISMRAAGTELVAGVVEIFCATLIPSTTRAKTVYCPSSAG